MATALFDVGLSGPAAPDYPGEVAVHFNADQVVFEVRSVNMANQTERKPLVCFQIHGRQDLIALRAAINAAIEMGQR